jgi:hypothetical protein
MIPVHLETVIDSLDVGDWLSVDLEEEPEVDKDGDIGPDATAIYAVRIGDVQFRIKAPFSGPGAIEVLAATRVSGEPRTKWPDLKNLRPQVVRMRRRRAADDPEDTDNSDEPEEPEGA